MNHRLFKLVTCKRLSNQRKNKIQTHLPSLSYMMGCVPFATPQTFSRMVVLPANALPMTRMRNCGHLYRSRSIAICSSSVSIVYKSVLVSRNKSLLSTNSMCWCSPTSLEINCATCNQGFVLKRSILTEHGQYY